MSEENLALDTALPFIEYPLIMIQDLLQYNIQPSTHGPELHTLLSSLFLHKLYTHGVLEPARLTPLFFICGIVCHTSEFHAPTFNCLTFTLLAMILPSLTLRPILSVNAICIVIGRRQKKVIHRHSVLPLEKWK